MRSSTVLTALLAAASAGLALAQDQTYPAGAYPFPQPEQPGAVSKTTFNPAIQNMGGSTNSAGTFNVVTISGTSSYQFQSVQQTSTFTPGDAAFGTPAPGATYSAGVPATNTVAQVPAVALPSLDGKGIGSNTPGGANAAAPAASPALMSIGWTAAAGVVAFAAGSFAMLV